MAMSDSQYETPTIETYGSVSDLTRKGHVEYGS
jgi:hypothetical protein